MASSLLGDTGWLGSKIPSRHLLSSHGPVGIINAGINVQSSFVMMMMMMMRMRMMMLLLMKN